VASAKACYTKRQTHELQAVEHVQMKESRMGRSGLALSVLPIAVFLITLLLQPG